MQKLIVKGKKILSGVIKVSGSKNATLPILAASILSDKKIVIKGIPVVKDVITMCLLLKYMGSNIKFDYKIDKELIGGLKLQLGSIMVDTSIKNKLKKYKQKMLEN